MRTTCHPWSRLSDCPRKASSASPSTSPVWSAIFRPLSLPPAFTIEWSAYSEDTNDYYVQGYDSDFSFTPTEAGNYGVYLYVSDKNGGSNNVYANILVVSGTNGDTAPTLTMPAAQHTQRRGHLQRERVVC